MEGATIAEVWRLGPDVDRTGISKIAGRLEDGTFLAIIKRNLLHIVQRELAQVYLPVLRIAQRNTVIADAQMMGAH